MTENQKFAYVLGGVMLSLASAGIIGGALALASEMVYPSIITAVVVFVYVAALYFSEGK